MKHFKDMNVSLHPARSIPMVQMMAPMQSLILDASARGLTREQTLSQFLSMMDLVGEFMDTVSPGEPLWPVEAA